MEETRAVRTLSFLVVTLAVYLLLWQLLSRFFDFPVYYYARLIELLGIGLFAALFLFTPMNFDEMGILVPKRVLFRSLSLGGGVALGLVALLVGGSFFLHGKVAFSLHVQGDNARSTYFLVAPMQEVLAKSVMLYSFESVFGGKHPHLANLMSALTFGAFHVVYGIRMMALAMLLCLITGWMFHRVRCVWGCALTHFAFGFLPLCFGFS